MEMLVIKFIKKDILAMNCVSGQFPFCKSHWVFHLASFLHCVVRSRGVYWFFNTHFLPVKKGWLLGCKRERAKLHTKIDLVTHL